MRARTRIRVERAAYWVVLSLGLFVFVGLACEWVSGWLALSPSAAVAPATMPEPEPASTDEPRGDPAEPLHWLNTATMTRHNRSCRHFNKTKEGRHCGSGEGTACRACGG